MKSVKLLAILLILAMVLGTIPMMAQHTGEDHFVGTAGVPNFSTLKANNGNFIGSNAHKPKGDYTEVKTVQDLIDIGKSATALAGKYILMNDIDLGGIAWTPLGNGKPDTDSPDNAEMVFSGVFDGNGYVISGLRLDISTSNDVYSGLFGYVKGTKIVKPSTADGETTEVKTQCEIKNLGIEVEKINVNIHSAGATACIGPLAGYVTEYVKISNCYVINDTAPTETFSESDSYSEPFSEFAEPLTTAAANFGGVVGVLSGNSEMTECYNVRNYRSDNYNLGGIVGAAESSKITKCFNTGEMVSQINAGGIVGTASGDGMLVSECYNTAPVTCLAEADTEDESAEFALPFTSGTQSAGGIVGALSESAKVESSCNHGAIVSSYQAGGIAGLLSNKAEVQSCYNAENVKALRGYAGGISAYASGDSLVTACSNYGKVEAASKGAACVGGILGCATEASVLDSFNKGDVYAESVNNAAYAGGIIAYQGTVGATIRDSQNEGNVTAFATNSSTYAGGVAGSTACSVLNCSNTGNITSTSNGMSGTARAGGIAGSAAGNIGTQITIGESCNKGAVASLSAKGDSYAGGLAGNAGYTKLLNCFNRGAVTCAAEMSSKTAYAGGLVGNGMFVEMNKLYNTGAVTATASGTSNVGMIAGMLDKSKSTVLSSYYPEGDDEAFGNDFVTAGARALTDTEMKDLNYFAKFSLNIWGIQSTTNSGYPYLLNTLCGEAAALPTPVEKPVADVDPMDYSKIISKVKTENNDYISKRVAFLIGDDKYKVGEKYLKVDYENVNTDESSVHDTEIDKVIDFDCVGAESYISYDYFKIFGTRCDLSEKTKVTTLLLANVKAGSLLWVDDVPMVYLTSDADYIYVLRAEGDENTVHLRKVSIESINADNLYYLPAPDVKTDTGKYKFGDKTYEVVDVYTGADTIGEGAELRRIIWGTTTDETVTRIDLNVVFDYDINNDSIIDIKDAAALSKKAFENKYSTEWDYNFDGKIDDADVAVIAEKVRDN